MKKHVSYSQISSYNSCPKAYEYGYIHGLTSVASNVEAITVGGLAHAGLAAAMKLYWENHQYTVADIMPEVKRAIGVYYAGGLKGERPSNLTIVLPGGETIESRNAWVSQATEIVERTLNHLDVPNNYEIMSYIPGKKDVRIVPFVEMKLEMKIPRTRQYYTGFVDVIWRNLNTGLIELVDWKTTTRIVGPETRQLDMQLPLYAHVIRETMGIEIDNCVVYQIRSEPLKRPRPDSKEFQALEYSFSQEITQKYWDNFVQSVFAIRRARRYPYPGVYGYACRTCMYSEMCLAETRGWDTSELLGSSFVYKDGYGKDTE